MFEVYIQEQSIIPTERRLQMMMAAVVAAAAITTVGMGALIAEKLDIDAVQAQSQHTVLTMAVPLSGPQAPKPPPAVKPSESAAGGAATERKAAAATPKASASSPSAPLDDPNARASGGVDNGGNGGPSSFVGGLPPGGPTIGTGRCIVPPCDDNPPPPTEPAAGGAAGLVLGRQPPRLGDTPAMALSADPALAADCFVSVAALVGVLIVLPDVWARGEHRPLSRRLAFGFVVLSVLLATRVLFWTTGVGLFDVLTIIAAATVPLATLILTEGLLRRHAPGFLKALTSIGTAVFTILAFVPDQFAEPWRGGALLAFQLGIFASAGWLVMARHRQSLSAAENRLAGRMALSLVLILPLAATDFRSQWLDAPVRLGGIAVLFLCWLAITTNRNNLSHRDAVVSFSAVVAAAFAAGLAASVIAGITDPAAIIRTVAMVLSAALVAVIYNDGIALRNEARRETLLRHLAHGDANDPDRFLEGLLSHPLVEGAAILEADDLADCDSGLLTELFARDSVRGRAGTGTDQDDDIDAREQLAWLFEKFEATHLLLVGRAPLKLLALSMPTIGSAPGVETELRAVQRMAILVRERDGKVGVAEK